MKNQPIITIGRQYGSGGRYVAKLLAEKMGIPYYDKELLTEASKDSGICKELLESYDEKQGKNLLFSLISGSQVRAEPGSMYMDMPLNHKIFLAQFDTIRRIADEGPCVIVGRCADYVLRDHKDLVSVFVHAPEEWRIEIIKKRHPEDAANAEAVMRRTDKSRAWYYSFYTGKTWGAASSYDLCLRSDLITVDDAVSLILAFAEAKAKT